MRPRNDETKMQVYGFINKYIGKYRISPSVREIAGEVNCSISTVHKFLVRLEEEEYRSNRRLKFPFRKTGRRNMRNTSAEIMNEPLRILSAYLIKWRKKRLAARWKTSGCVN